MPYSIDENRHIFTLVLLYKAGLRLNRCKIVYLRVSRVEHDQVLRFLGSLGLKFQFALPFKVQMAKLGWIVRARKHTFNIIKFLFR